MNYKEFRFPEQFVRVRRERTVQGVTRNKSEQEDRPGQAQPHVPSQKIQVQLEIGETTRSRNSRGNSVS